MTVTTSKIQTIPIKKIFKTWWPLAASWFFMSLESIGVSAVIARLANPEINLAAYGGIVAPVAIIIESPVIMLLSASTALSKDWSLYRQLRRYMIWLAAAVTGIHLLVTFTPLYYFIVRTLIGAPEEIIAPARIGLAIMLPWSAAIAYRRFNQGVLIRFGHSDAVAVGTAVRLMANAVVLTAAYLLGGVPGVVAGAVAQALGVTSEAVYVGFRVRPVLVYQVRHAPPADPITLKEFSQFYIPLALTSLMTFIWQPIGSAGISRMPNPIDSLAVWPVISGLTFMLRSLGIALNEVVVAMLDQPRSFDNLRRFTRYLSATLGAISVLIAVTPLSLLWFNRVSALPPSLSEIAQIGFLLSIPMASLATSQSWYQGLILHGRNTRGIPESVAIFLISAILILGVGVVWGAFAGAYVGSAAYTLASLAQTAWLWHRSLPVQRNVQKRDGEVLPERVPCQLTLPAVLPP